MPIGPKKMCWRRVENAKSSLQAAQHWLPAPGETLTPIHIEVALTMAKRAVEELQEAQQFAQKAIAQAKIQGGIRGRQAGQRQGQDAGVS